MRKQDLKAKCLDQGPQLRSGDRCHQPSPAWSQQGPEALTTVREAFSEGKVAADLCSPKRL